MKVLKNCFNIVFIIFVTVSCTSLAAFAQNNNEKEFDIIRSQMSYLNNQNSKEYKDLNKKLIKIVKKEKIDYTQEVRFNDALRLMEEKKYDAAIYELKSLIKENYNVSCCNELLGDICHILKKPIRKTVKYYENAIEYDNSNVSALYKLSKLYFSKNKNIIGLEYLSKAIEATDDLDLLNRIETLITTLIETSIEPNDKYEVNNFCEILADVQLKLGKKLDAYENYLTAIQINPYDIYLKYHVVDLMYKDEYNPIALQLIDAIALEEKNDTQIKVTKAKLLFQKGNTKSAYEEYLKILKQNPDSKQAKYGIYKLFENELPPEKILSKVNANNKSYLLSKNECQNFAQLLEEFDEIEGANKYKALVIKLETIKTQKEEKIQNKKNANTLPKENTTPDTVQKDSKEIALTPIEKKEETAVIVPEEKKVELKAVQNDKKEEITGIQPLQSQQPEQIQQVEQPKEVQQVQEAQQPEQSQEVQPSQPKQIQQPQQIQQAQQTQQIQLSDYEKRKIASELKTFQTKNPEKYTKYTKSLNDYLKTEPKDDKIFVAIANTYKLLEAPTASLKYYKEAIKLNPAESDLYYNIALSYMELNSFETAYYNLNKAIGLNSDNIKAKTLLPFVRQKLVTRYINNAYAKFEEKKYLEASNILDEAIKKFPGNGQLYYYRALSYDAMNRNAAAIIDLQKATSLDPSLYMGYYQLGKSYEKIKDERNALVTYERFLSTEPDEKDLVDEVQKKVILLGQKYY